MEGKSAPRKGRTTNQNSQTTAKCRFWTPSTNENGELVYDWWTGLDPRGLYLLSVALMFGGLYVASAAGVAETALKATGFFLIQNAYEAVILFMGLYLVKKGLARDHGKLLMFFSLVFLTDATMYQIRSTGAWTGQQSWIGLTISLMYLITAGIKILIAAKVLGITPRPVCVAHAISALGLIYFLPHYMNGVLEGRGSDSSFGWWEIYMVWIGAAATQIPVIVRYWKDGGLSKKSWNQGFGDENSFYRGLATVVFLALPFQIIMNIHPDSRIVNPGLHHLHYCAVPYFAFGVFFVESLWKTHLERRWNLADLQFVALTAVLALAIVSNLHSSNVFGKSLVSPHTLNLWIVLGCHGVLALVRKNRMCAGVLVAAGAVNWADDAIRAGASFLHHAGWLLDWTLSGIASCLRGTADAALALGKTIGRIPAAAWAIMMMTASFGLLWAGFSKSRGR